MKKRLAKWWLDLLLFFGFTLAFYVSQTGVSLHQWIGIGCGAAALFHLVLHWKWVCATTTNFLSPKGKASRKYLLVNALLLAGFSTTIGTGIAMATWFDLELKSYSTWRTVHIAAPIITLGVALVKIYLHWHWIVAGFHKIADGLFAEKPDPKRKAVSANVISRREFLSLLSVLGPISLITMGRSVDTLLEVAELKEAEEEQCLIRRCWSQCHFPGKCGNYVDRNNSKRCDLGECLRKE